MASNPPAACCAIGIKHEGEAKGQLQQIGDVEVYISHPERSTKRAILLLTNVVGHRFINAQLIADQLTANGYLVVMPDLFHGDPMPLNNCPASFDLMSWLKGPPGHLPDRVEPVVQAILKEMKSNMGCERVGAVGYCFGAKYAVRLLQPGLCDVAYVAHPSFVDAEELQAIQGPLSIAAAETDSIFPASKRHESEDILAKTGQPYQINLFSGVEHGFAVRADITNPIIRFAKESAFYRHSHGLISTSNQSGRQIYSLVTIKL